MNNKKILIDGSNSEEIRVAIVSNNELEDYDVEFTNKEIAKGNIYLAKVTRVEASLQAAFVEYGRNKQGFLPFSEISIDYFNLPNEKKDELRNKEIELKNAKYNKKDEKESKTDSIVESSVEETNNISDIEITTNETTIIASSNEDISIIKVEEEIKDPLEDLISQTENSYFTNLTTDDSSNKENSNNNKKSKNNNNNEESEFRNKKVFAKKLEGYLEEDSGYGARFGYKIQDVINKNQYIIVQVVKDERGNKGASLTTYLSIPGRYSVLMPNSYNLEGGVSKKIINIAERTRLKNILATLNIPKTFNVIIRTAGTNKTAEEITQDYQYINSLWENIKEQAASLKSPSIIYEEGSLVKKVIRDIYSNEIDEIYIEGKNTYYSAVNFAKLIAPDIAKKIKLYKSKNESLFQHFNIEEQVKSLYSPLVFLKSGGYIVIHPTEALTSIDVNSGKFKGNRNVEETALKNNLEAAEEIAKQLRLRDIGGLIVIDFIDMENSRNRAIIEKKLKDEVRNDKAKIQIGQISNFGLLEMARQHVKLSLFEKSFSVCPKCQGIGYVNPLELNVLQILRDIGLEAKKNSYSGSKLCIKIPTKEAFYILNNKREALIKLENLFNSSIRIECDDNVTYPYYIITDVSNEKTDELPNTVLLLETEIANNINSVNNTGNHNKPYKAKFHHNKQHEHRNKRHHNNRQQNTNNKQKVVVKKSFLQKIFGR